VPGDKRLAVTGRGPSGRIQCVRGHDPEKRIRWRHRADSGIAALDTRGSTRTRVSPRAISDVTLDRREAVRSLASGAHASPPGEKARQLALDQSRGRGGTRPATIPTFSSSNRNPVVERGPSRRSPRAEGRRGVALEQVVTENVKQITKGHEDKESCTEEGSRGLHRTTKSKSRAASSQPPKCCVRKPARRKARFPISFRAACNAPRPAAGECELRPRGEIFDGYRVSGAARRWPGEAAHPQGARLTHKFIAGRERSCQTRRPERDHRRRDRGLNRERPLGLLGTARLAQAQQEELRLLRLRFAAPQWREPDRQPLSERKAALAALLARADRATARCATANHFEIPGSKNVRARSQSQSRNGRCSAPRRFAVGAREQRWDECCALRSESGWSIRLTPLSAANRRRSRRSSSCCA